MTTYPSIDELKTQARRLRQAMAERGDDMSHSTALELIAKQHGLRDWNTLSALAANRMTGRMRPLMSAPLCAGVI